MVIIAHSVHEIYSSESVVFGIVERFLNFDNFQPELVSDVISGTADQNVSMDVCADFGDSDSRLKPSVATFSALFRTSITSYRKYVVTSYPVWL